MGKEIDLLNKYPKTKRNLSERAEAKTEEDRAIARKFEKDFFDGDRKHGYGGFYYNPRFWKDVVEDFRDYWNLNSGSSVLDVGCGKGFMLYDLVKLLPGINIAGVDISNYAIENSVESIKPFLKVANAKSLPYEDKSFDVVISINTVHNLEEEDLITSLKEIERVSKKFSFITVDAYNNDLEKERMFQWNLTAKTIKSVPDWKEFFIKNNYNGDFYWFTP